jgi:NADPH-dependent 2,4-dienoyl-CoA reductase/sulfur reductase-like enzyme/rhodanese-related sulfurtransferase
MLSRSKLFSCLIQTLPSKQNIKEQYLMDNHLRVLIIGGVACGPKSASRLKRLMPEADITMIERCGLVSYGACGLPYYVEGMYPEIRMVNETPIGVIRDGVFFEKVKGFKTITRTEAIWIDRNQKRVGIKNLDTERESELSYDKLILATGSSPIQPPIPGIDLGNVWYMRHPDDAETMVDQIETQNLRKAVIIGAGYIGVEMAEALIRRGLEVTMVEVFDQIMPQFLDYDMATLAAKHLRQKGVRLALKETVLAVEGKADKVASVVTDIRKIDTDLVLVGVGVHPNDQLAREAGLTCAHKGGIVINGFCQTSDPDIYAGGDCVVNHSADPQIKDSLFIPLGSTANKHGRVIADHIAGIANPFVGITGTGICRAFDLTLGRTGLTEKQAKKLYSDIETVIWAGPDMPHYIPESKPLVIKMVASRQNRKLLGVQVVGMGNASKRLDVAASAIFYGATVDQVGNIDLGYAPPYAPPLDPIATTAHVLQNKLNGIAKGISPLEAKQRMDNGDDIVLLDVRSPEEFMQMRLPGDNVVHIPLGALRQKLDQLPKSKDILAFCKVSMRGYEAQRILVGAGFDRVAFIEGGLVGWPFDIWTAGT